MLNFMKMIENISYYKCNHPKCNNKGQYNYEKNGYSYCYQHKKTGMIMVNQSCIIC